MKVNNKGFTLVELLTVVLILTLLVLLVWPNISNSVDNKKSDIDNLTLNIIEEATKLYISDNKDGFPEVEGNTYCVPLKQLINQDYLKDNIEYSKEDISDIKTMKVFYDDGFNYVLVDNNDCTKILTPKSFAEDDWDTIISNVKSGNTSKYKVGDEKEITLTSTDPNINGTYTVRIANMSTPEECGGGEFSQTACGFVVEFVDIITERGMNSSITSVGGWRDSDIREYINNDIFNSFPETLKKNILSTYTVSGAEPASYTYKTHDKLYLLTTTEIWGPSSAGDSAKDKTRQLDYYKNYLNEDGSIGVTTEKYSGAAKGIHWWLRAALDNYQTFFLYVFFDGSYASDFANSYHGVAPAFRL